MKPKKSVILAETTVTPWYPVSTFGESGHIGFGVQVIGTGSVTTAYTVQHTFQDVFKESSVAATRIFDHSTVSGQSTSMEGSYLYPISAIRLKVSALATAATVQLTYVQAGT